jgi:alcohol dehydrogenase class IV
MKFHMPTEIVFGAGMISELGRILDRRHYSRVLLVTDKGVEAAGIVSKVLEQAVPQAVFDEIEPNPKHETVERGGDLARKLKPDLVIGLGGGSVLDAAKAIALLATNPGRIEDYEGREKYLEAPLPVLAIPTTCGTGSEVTWVSIITHTGRRVKMSIKGPLMYPAVALVDPDLLMTLPPHLVASTGFDALTHAIEAFTAKPATAITDGLAQEALRLIFRSLPGVHPDIGKNPVAREELMLGSVLAGMAFVNSDVGAVHCLAESIGAIYDTPHGLANAVLLPFVMEFNQQAAEAKYARIAALAGIEVGNQEEAAARLIQKIQALSRVLSIPKFKDLGIPERDFELIAQKSFENNSNSSNPREALAADYLAILSRASRAIR